VIRGIDDIHRQNHESNKMTVFDRNFIDSSMWISDYDKSETPFPSKYRKAFMKKSKKVFKTRTL
jgi:menaquinone-dependent protoporphyrinogen IX oxidase